MAAKTEKLSRHRKYKRRYNVRLLKATWPYTVQEIAALFNIHKGAVLRWLNEGLQADKDRRPYLIRGDELIRFLSERQQKKKCKCAIHEFFCFKCRAPRRACLDMVDIVFISPMRFRVKGICETCNTPVHKAQGIGKLQKIREIFNVQQIEGRHIIERSESIVNSDMEAQT